MWAGVQNVSRPIERCQAMSQCDPTIAEVTAMTADQTYHEMADSREGVIGLAISTVLSHVGQEWNRRRYGGRKWVRSVICVAALWGFRRWAIETRECPPTPEVARGRGTVA